MAWLNAISSSTALLLLLLAVGTFLVSNAIAGWIERRKARDLQGRFERVLQAAPEGERVIPVTIVTGFLGSGKTVLLNRLLANPGGRRICVIENEAGAVSIDHALLRDPNAPSSGPSNVIVLKNGCICCSSSGKGDELSRTLGELLALADSSPGGGGEGDGAGPQAAENSTAASAPPAFPFDYVVIELSGLADPAPLVQTFHKASLTGARYALDSVVAVVDAKHIRHHLDGDGFLSRMREAGQQVAYADVVLLNKIDAASTSKVEAAEEAIRRCNPTAELHRCSYAAVDTEVLLDRKAFDISRAGELLREQLAEDSADGGERAASSSSSSSSSSSLSSAVAPRHSQGVRALTLDAFDVAVPSAALIGWLRELVVEKCNDLYRVKGLLYVFDDDGEKEGSGGRKGERSRSQSRGKTTPPKQAAASAATPYLFAVHGVHAELQGLRVDEGEGGGDDRGGHTHTHSHLHPALVLIGKGLDEAKVRASFKRVVLDAGTRYRAADACKSCEGDAHGTESGGGAPAAAGGGRGGGRKRR